jgi:O-antigen/teichoic acid export membrane protein
MTVVVRLTRIVLGLVTSILTARFLGPDGRGDYTLVVTLAALVVQFGNLGLHSSNTYLVAKDRGLYNGLVSNSIAAAALSIPLSAIAVWVASLLDGRAGNWLWWAAALAPASLFLLLGSNLLVGMGRIALFNLFEFAYAALVVPLIVVAGFLGGGVGGILFASVAAAWMASIVLLVVLLRGPVCVRFDAAVLRASVRFATKAYVIALLGFLLLRANVFLLERFAGSAELGQYSVASQIADVLTVLPASIALVVFPRLVAERERRWPMLLRSTRTTALLIVVLCIAAAVVASPFIGFAFGAAFMPAVPILLFLLPGIVLLAVTTILSQYLAARGLPLTLAGAWAIALLTGIFASWILIPSAGGVGASIGLTVAYAVLFVLVSIVTIVERNRELPPSAGQRTPA